MTPFGFLAKRQALVLRQAEVVRQFDRRQPWSGLWLAATPTQQQAQATKS